VGSGLGVHVGLGTGRLLARVDSGLTGCGVSGPCWVQGSEWVSRFVLGSTFGLVGLGLGFHVLGSCGVQGSELVSGFMLASVFGVSRLGVRGSCRVRDWEALG
jgi:hypothetical protein